MAVTVICCNLCLMQVRAAALLLSLVVTIPFLVFFIHTGQPVLIAIAFNMLLVTTGMTLAMPVVTTIPSTISLSRSGS